MQAHLYFTAICSTYASRHANKAVVVAIKLGTRASPFPFSIFTILTGIREKEQRVDKVVVVNSKGDANCNQLNSSIFLKERL